MDIQQTAIIKIEPYAIEAPGLPGEVAIAFPDGRVRTWFVQPEPSNLNDDAELAAEHLSLATRYRRHRGRPAFETYEEVSHAIRGYHLYAEDPIPSAWRLSHLARLAGKPTKPMVDIHELADLIAAVEGSSASGLTHREAIDAVRPFERASVEVQRCMQVLRMLIGGREGAGTP
jgi:hypothetical protein